MNGEPDRSNLDRTPARIAYFFAFSFSVLMGFANPRDVVSQTITEFPIPGIVGGTDHVTQGPDGNLWFTNGPASMIGYVTPDGDFTEFADPYADAYPDAITSGPDGNLWFITNGIGRITTSGIITEFPAAACCGITGGPDGKLWFASSQRIGRITTSGSVEILSAVLAGNPYGLTAGPDGNVWFTEPQTNKIGRMTPAGSLTEYDVPSANAFPFNIAAGPDGNLWFTESGLLGGIAAIGRITTSGSFTEFPVPSQGSGPNGLCVGPDGNIWFTESVNIHQLGRITMSGVVTEFPGPSFSPWGITAGPDGSVWFAEGDKIGTMSTQPPAAVDRDIPIPVPNDRKTIPLPSRVPGAH